MCFIYRAWGLCFIEDLSTDGGVVCVSNFVVVG